MRGWLGLAIALVVGAGAGVAIGAAIWGGADHGAAAVSSAGSGTVGVDGAGRGETSHGASAVDERTFLEEMVPHHASAVAMAELVVARTDRPQLRQLARAIVATQEQEIGAMRGIFQDSFGAELVPSPSGSHANVDLGPLATATGDDLDRLFLEMMIPHHASAIVAADAVNGGNPSDAVRALAGGIIATQSEEIGRMQGWLEAWFPRSG